MTEEEKKEFEEFLKWKAERTSANASPTDTGKGAVKLLCVVINVLTYVNQNRNHLAVLDFST